MRLLGLDISLAKSSGSLTQTQVIGDRGNWWWPVVREPFSGAWQRNVEVRTDLVLSYNAVYSCISRISSDISKLRMKLLERDADGIAMETTSPSFSPVLRRPNRYQNRIKFLQIWLISKLVHGNTYLLKVRDNRKIVTALYILDPARVRVSVAPDGSIYYELRRDDLSGITDETVLVPASEIIHDIHTPLYHPLVGVSPIYACGLGAMQGLNIQRNSTDFFQNGAKVSGVLSAPAHIDDDTAKRVKEHWDTEYQNQNAGKIAVLGDGLKFESMSMNAIDAQLIEQLKWTAEQVCSCFRVPGYMVNIGTPPTYNNIEALNQQYYSQCLQELIESIELCLEEGLGLTGTYEVELDLEGLLRMDTAAQYKAIGDGIVGGFLKPNEGRAKLNLPKVKGGDTPYLQQQNYSLAALAKRDSQADPFNKVTPSAPAPAGPAEDDPADDPAATKQLAMWELRSALGIAA